MDRMIVFTTHHRREPFLAKSNLALQVPTFPNVQKLKAHPRLLPASTSAVACGLPLNEGELTIPQSLIRRS